MKRVHAVAGLVLSIGFAACAGADEPMALGFVESGRELLGLYSAASGNFAVADVDNDGLQDLVFSGTSTGSSLIVVGHRADNSIGLKQFLFLPDANVPVRVLSTRIDTVSHVLVAMGDGTVRDFSGWPLSETTSFSTLPGARAAAGGDLYGNGGSEIVVVNADLLAAYSLTTHQVMWSLPIANASDVALAQLDGDPAQEVIVAAHPGMVIDGATQAVDWEYPGGFGASISSGHLVGDGTNQFAAISGFGTFTVYGSAPWASQWTSNNVTSGIDVAVVANLDNNGRDVILQGNSQINPVIHVINPATHQDRYTIPSSGSGTAALAALDIDGDDVPEIAVALKYPGANDFIKLVDSRNGQTKWAFKGTGGQFSPLAIGDVDGDGQAELVVADNEMVYRQSVDVFDMATGALEWNSPPPSSNANDPYFLSVSQILLSPHSGASGMDIVLAGTSMYDGRVSVVDGVSHTVKFQIGTFNSGPMQNRYLTQAALVDFDLDGVSDFIAGTQSQSGGNLQVFAGSDGHVLWTSPDLGNTSSVAVFATGPATLSSSELIAVSADVARAYSIQTHLLDWSLPVEADGATFLPQGVSGPEIAVFRNSGEVAFYGLATQANLRSFVLPSPLNALQPIDGDTSHLLAVSTNELCLVDAESGAIQARTPFLGQNLGLNNRLAVVARDGASWDIASGNSMGVMRHRLQMVPDTLFADGFDN